MHNAVSAHKHLHTHTHTHTHTHSLSHIAHSPHSLSPLSVTRWNEGTDEVTAVGELRPTAPTLAEANRPTPMFDGLGLVPMVAMGAGVGVAGIAIRALLG